MRKYCILNEVHLFPIGYKGTKFSDVFADNVN